MTARGADPNSEIESGFSLVRLVLALVGGAVVVGSETARHNFDLAVVQLMAIAVVTVGLSLLRRTLERLHTGLILRRATLQIADIAASVGLVVVISRTAPDAGWVLLALPIVISSLRLGAGGVLLTWAGTCSAYLLVLRLDLVAPGPEAFETSLVVERPGTLLALAAAVAVMTRWLQQGWIHQANVTSEVEQHLGYVRSIEQAGRVMRHSDRDGVIEICLDHLLDLGFETSTAGMPGDGLLTRGQANWNPPREDWPVPKTGTVEVTEWSDDAGTTIYGAAAVEPRTGRLITGWSATDPTNRSLESLTDLLAYTTTSIDLADLLAAARHDADHDPLTGLMNRAALDRHVDRVAAMDQPVALLFIDVDYFKRINDLRGHQLGDAVLVEVAKQIESTVPTQAVAARFGGDEFVIVLQGSDAIRAPEIARSLWEARQVALTIDGSKIELHLSIGVGIASAPLDPAELAARADRALYQAKEAGRNTVRIHRSDDPLSAPRAVAKDPERHEKPEPASGPTS